MKKQWMSIFSLSVCVILAFSGVACQFGGKDSSSFDSQSLTSEGVSTSELSSDSSIDLKDSSVDSSNDSSGDSSDSGGNEDEVEVPAANNMLVGKFTDREIKDEQAAILAVQDVAEELGLKDAADELTSKSANAVENLTYYRLQQNYKGIPVYGSEFVVVADANGEAKGVTGNVSDIDTNISLTPTVTQAQVKASIQAYIGEDIEVSVSDLSDDMLVIYNSDEGNKATLAYELYVEMGNTPYTVVVEAYKGDVLSTSALSYSENVIATGTNLEGQRVHFNTLKDDDTYYLYDTERNIKVFNSNGELVQDGAKAIPVENASTTWNNPSAVTLMEKTAVIYDFYKMFFQLKGFDNKNGLLHLTYNDGCGNNAHSLTKKWTKKEWLIFGDEVTLEISLIAHEYMHSVERKISGMKYKNESGAIMEGYSDVFGEILEDWYNDGELDNDCDWKNELRTINAPWEDERPTQYNGQYFKPNKEKKDFENGAQWEIWNSFAVHENSTVISHMAYLMTHNDFGESLTMMELARLWYHTLNRLPKNCTFSRLRQEMVEKAKTLNFTAAQIDCIERAFNRANIEHIHTFVIITQEATCTVDGWEKEVCSCGEGNVITTIPARHIFSEWEVTKEATTTESGVRQRTCYSCGGIQIDTIPMLEEEEEKEEEKEEDPPIVEVVGSKGLEYELNFNSTSSYSVVGIGSCTDTDLVIPSMHAGLPVTTIGQEAFRSCSEITSVTIPNTIEQIYMAAFIHCTGLESITIPNSVTFIGSWAFSGCENLESVKISKSMTKLSSITFSDCTKLVNVDGLEGVEEIGASAFSRCTALTNISLSNKLKVIKSGAFSYTSLTEIHFPSSLETIDGDAFSNCHGLTSVKIPASVTTLGAGVFSNCSGLTSVTIPDTVTTLGGGAFSNCENLESVSLGNGITTIDCSLFAYCFKLKNVTLGKSIIRIDDQAFMECTSLSSITIPNEVVWMGEKVFSKCSALVNVTLPSGLKRISSAMFSNCTSLEAIELPASLETIDRDAFLSCRSLKKISIPNSVQAIYENAFASCDELFGAFIPASVTCMKSDVFSGCNKLTVYCEHESQPFDWAEDWVDSQCYVVWGCKALAKEEDDKGLEYTFLDDGTYAVIGIGSNIEADLLIPSTHKGRAVTKIEDSAFSNCSSLVNVIIGNNITNIGRSSFENCNNLASVEISDSVTNIGWEAFRNCAKLTTVKVGNGLTDIGSDAFEDCTKLEHIYIKDLVIWCAMSGLGNIMNHGMATKKLYLNNQVITDLEIPNGVTTIATYAFFKYSSLTSVRMADSVTKIDKYAFAYCDNLVNVEIGNNVTIIADYAFYSCITLESVTISNSVTTIEEGAFADCTGLTSIVIPENVEFIGRYAFYGSSNLSSIEFSNTVGWSAEYIKLSSEKIADKEGIAQSLTSSIYTAYDWIRTK